MISHHKNQGVENGTRISALEKEREELKRTIRRVREKLKQVKNRYEEERTERDAMYRQSEAESHLAVESMSRELASERSKLEMAVMARETAVLEEKRWRQTATKYKKKVSQQYLCTCFVSR